jgi:amino acid transporter
LCPVHDPLIKRLPSANIRVFGHFYCWIVGILFGAWEFNGYDTSVHLAKETNEASEVIAKGMWAGTLPTWLLSVPTLVILIFCIRNFDAIVNGTYANNFTELCLQALSPKGATTVLILCWLDSTCSTTICILSAQRVTYAISCDGILSGSKYFRKLFTNKRIPVNAALLVLAFGIAISCIIVGPEVASFTLTATTTIATNVSYAIPIAGRQTVGRKQFRPTKWHLVRFSVPCTIIGGTYTSFLFVVLCLLQVYLMTALTLNYAPIMIGGVTILMVVGWIFLFGLGGRYWFHGLSRTISEQKISKARVCWIA